MKIALPMPKSKADILRDSFGTVWASFYNGNNSFLTIPTSAIISVVSMQPLPPKSHREEGLWFVIEKSGLEDAELSGSNDIDDNYNGVDNGTICGYAHTPSLILPLHGMWQASSGAHYFTPGTPSNPSFGSGPLPSGLENNNGDVTSSM
ncbi:hypothetical protein AX17_004431, partial [Amanita inopinata Kibby_2008]